MTAALTSEANLPLEGFSVPVQSWFSSTFESPTRVQVDAWTAIRSGRNALIIAPTGSGKTLAAFMWAIDRLAQEHSHNKTEDENEPDSSWEPGVRILYISPLKALGVDVERNLRAPLAGIREASIQAGLEPPNITVGVRSGDTSASERRRLVTHPPDILITTPESLYLLLTSKGAETLKTVETVIVDEVHALADDKRGAHLALSLERLDLLLQKPAVRIGLSATVEPASEVARFLGGAQPVEIVRPPGHRNFDITVEVPVEDMSNPPVTQREVVNAGTPLTDHRIGSMWPPIEQSLYGRILQANSTIVFTNSRRLAERLTSALNQIHADQMDVGTGGDAPVLARAHHGSVAKETRALVEEELKSGNLKCVVATGSLELGIDMGEVDLVVQIDPPPSVSSGLQRLGRSGHQVGGTSKAVFYPTNRSKLLETAIISLRMQSGQIEPLRVLSNPLDVLAQQTIAQSVLQPIDVEDWFRTVRRAAPFADLPRSAYQSVLDLISGRFPSTEFSSLRARVDWDRAAGTLSARPGARRLAVTNGGTIPDRGLYRVVTGSDDGPQNRVGELDEEMVHETRVGEVFTLGTTAWRVRNIGRDSVEVEPAFGQIAKTPFWRGDSMSRPIELGRALGDLTDELADDKTGQAQGTLEQAGFDRFATDNTLAYLHEQVQATGHVPTGKSLIVEKTRDEVGDWLYVLESPLGLAVHSPWALAINARLRERWGLESNATPSNDGIIVRIPDMDSDFDMVESNLEPAEFVSRGAPAAEDIFIFDPDEIMASIHEQVQGSAVFAARFREASSRALILGNSKPGKRTPLWAQRLRAAELLEVASRYPQFPMVLEGVREVLQDVYDTASLTKLMRDFASRSARLVEVTTEHPSPFARSLLFGYVGEFLYQGDAPAGERKIAALTVDPEVLRELLGEVPLRDLLEPEAIEEVVAELQRTRDGWQAHGVTGLVDLLRTLGPLTDSEISARIAEDEDSTELVTSAVTTRQAFRFRVGGFDYVAAAEDAGILVEASGVPVPSGTSTALLEVSEDPVRQLLIRFAASRGPFSATEVASRFGLAHQTVKAELRNLQETGLLLQGLFLPPELAGRLGVDPNSAQWVSRGVLDRIRTRSLALLRGAVEPVRQTTYATFLAQWQHCDRELESDSPLRGAEGLYTALEQLSGYPLPASAWETLVLPARIDNYQPGDLDALVSNGEFTWVGTGKIGSRDGWIKFVPTGLTSQGPNIGPRADSQPELQPRSELETAIIDELNRRGALFAGAILDGLVSREVHVSSSELATALWNLVWDGVATSDSVSALRARVSGKRSAQKTAPRRFRGRTLTTRNLAGVSSMRTSVPDPSLAGRWSLVSAPGQGIDSSAQDGIVTVQSIDILERYGIVTRGSVTAEDFLGGFAQAYRFYSNFEVQGVCRRGYFVKGLGGAQFAVPGAIDLLRQIEEQGLRNVEPRDAWTLATTDPANPYGASLPWPENMVGKRNAGALVTIVSGAAVLYVERGGKTMLAQEDTSELEKSLAVSSLVRTVRRGDLSTFTVELVNGIPVRESSWAGALLAGGFSEVPRGLVLRRKLP